MNAHSIAVIEVARQELEEARHNRSGEYAAWKKLRALQRQLCDHLNDDGTSAYSDRENIHVCGLCGKEML